MKRTIKKEVAVCNTCETEANKYAHCLKCGEDFCSFHEKENCVVYWNRAEGDGIAFLRYCKPCDMALSESRADPLHNAVMEVQRLRDEWMKAEREFMAKAKAARDALDALLPADFRLGRV